MRRQDFVELLGRLEALTPQQRALVPRRLHNEGGSMGTRVAGIVHRTINVRRGVRVVDGVFHIQNVNAYDSRLKGWMRRFHGVATRYLENYLGWRRLIERYATTITPAACLAEAIGRPINN